MKKSANKISRRAFGQLLAVTGVASAQRPSREEELRAAQQRRQSNSETLAKFDVPMATEPAFVFRP
jgi:hypothetical protein